MPSLGSKKEIAKRDLNFFADFTAAAAKMTRLLGYGIFAGVVVVAAILAVIGYCVVRNIITQAAIDELNKTLQSEEYSGLENRAVELQKELSDFNNYYYSLSQMRDQVEKKIAVPMTLPQKIKDAIPSDSYVESYLIEESTMTIEGYTFSYYSALNLVNMLNNSDVFAIPVQLTVERVDPGSVGTYESFLKNAINNYYKFRVEGTLTGDVYISVARYLQDNTAVSSLGAMETTSYEAGSAYAINEVATYTQAGITYNLVGVSVNNSSLSKDAVDAIIAANSISGLANSNNKIQLYYEAPAAEGGN